MNIRFGSNEYEMLPNSGLDTYDGSLHLSLLADNVDFEDLEEVEEIKIEELETSILDGVNVDDPVRMYLREIGKIPLLSFDAMSGQ